MLKSNASSACSADEYKPVVCPNPDDLSSTVVVPYCALFIVCFASFKISFYVSDRTFLPRGSGFLIIGLIAGLLTMVKNPDCFITILVRCARLR